MALYETDLDLARRHVAEAEATVRHQKGLVAALAGLGCDTDACSHALSVPMAPASISSASHTRTLEGTAHSAPSPWWITCPSALLGPGYRPSICAKIQGRFLDDESGVAGKEGNFF